MPFRNAIFQEMLLINAAFLQMLFKNANRMPFRNAIFKEMLLEMLHYKKWSSKMPSECHSEMPFFKKCFAS
jgi:hypothetical protein